MTIRTLWIFFIITLGLMQQHTNAVSFSLNSITSRFFKQNEEVYTTERQFKRGSTLIVKNQNGSIKIKGWPFERISIKAVKQAPEKEIDMLSVGIDAKSHQIKINTCCKEKKAKGQIDYYLFVPEDTHLQLATQSGSIKIKNISGRVEAITGYGTIESINSTNDQFIKNTNGPATIRMKSVASNARLILQASSGLSLFLPPTIDASISAKSPHGSIYSEIPLTIEAKTMKITRQTWSAWRKSLAARMGSGLADIQLICTNGSIKVLEN